MNYVKDAEFQPYFKRKERAELVKKYSSFCKFHVTDLLSWIFVRASILVIT